MSVSFVVFKPGYLAGAAIRFIVPIAPPFSARAAHAGEPVPSVRIRALYRTKGIS